MSKNYQDFHVKRLKIGQNEYPLKLAKIADAPAALFYKGVIPQNSINIAIVGSRKISDYGASALKHIFDNLNDRNVCVISGLAYGVDGEAHKMSLKNGLLTVAVLGTPIDKIYPAEHTRLAEQILNSGGAIISEPRPEDRTMKWSFAQRNRIIAGLSDATVIVEAAEGSGALITAGYALQYGRKLFAVPGSIFSENCRGTNALLAKGAIPLTSLNDLLREFPQIKNRDILPESDDGSIGNDLQKIYSLISKQPASIHEIAAKANMPAGQISYVLSMLEINGKISRLLNDKYVRSQ